MQCTFESVVERSKKLQHLNMICIYFLFLFIADQGAAQPHLTQAIARALNATLQLATRINPTPQTPNLHKADMQQTANDYFFATGSALTDF